MRALAAAAGLTTLLTWALAGGCAATCEESLDCGPYAGDKGGGGEGGSASGGASATGGSSMGGGDAAAGGGGLGGAGGAN